MTWSAAENDRRAANILMVGTIASVNADAARARVNFGELGSPEIPVGQMRAGALSFWWMPQVGEQVLVGCPGGDIAQGVILCSIFAGNAPSSNGGEPMIQLNGGTLQINGSIELTGDVTAQGVSLLHHRHGGVQVGGAQTGEPT